ncbi:MAG: glycosyltransferase family 2 protein [Deltaproteobacteria bacterium]|nr:glycosyltransferase family 2 protein [Deltaproteobacteria bacterium]MBW2534817.1 glycosyltransferase family 2 protein [Deltaproteobacteria bacterium]
MTENILIGAYLTILGLLAIYGFHRSQLVYLFFKPKNDVPRPSGQYSELPFVTIQLPMFNERYVAQRLIETMGSIDYPRDRFEVQVLDDSTDDTTEIAQAKVDEMLGRGIDIKLIHRTDRIGYKAGALENGLRTARGEFVAVFDADFLPQPSVLRDTVHYFSDPDVGMVQVRWGHINRRYSLLTRIQSLMLDGHFVIEHGARQRSGRFFNFNGTAGIWRRAAISDAGGWEHDTLTEDMDLSYRAQLKGWKFIYLPEVVAPAEIPVEMASFKSQQHRWAKGSIQVARKMLPVILKSDVPFKVKCEAFFHLTNNLAYVLMILLALLLMPNLLVRTEHGWREVLLIDLPLFMGTTFSIGTFYVVAHKELYGGVWKAIAKVPLLMSLGIGLSINNAKAVLEGLVGHETEFVRTAKHGGSDSGCAWRKMKYRARKGLVPLIELTFAAYFIYTIYVAVSGGHWVSLPFLALFLLGYLYVGAFSVYQRR